MTPEFERFAGFLRQWVETTFADNPDAIAEGAPLWLGVAAALGALSGAEGTHPDPRAVLPVIRDALTRLEGNDRRFHVRAAPDAPPEQLENFVTMAYFILCGFVTHVEIM